MDIFGEAPIAYLGDDMARHDDKDVERRRRDIEDVIREEVSRRHPIDMDAIREGLRLRDDYWALVRGRDEEKFRAFLTALGWEPGSPVFERFVRAWRGFQR